MATRLPDPAEIADLVAFLPSLSAPGFTPVRRWGGGPDAAGALHAAWPEYDPTVLAFFQRASAAPWIDASYDPAAAATLLRTPGLVETATLAQIRTLLTYCTRGERFSDGHWAALIEQGHLRRLLTRLAQLHAAHNGEQS